MAYFKGKPTKKSVKMNAGSRNSRKRGTKSVHRKK